MNDFSLGIDFGTSGARAIAINGTGEILAITRTDYQLRDYATWQIALYELIRALPIKIKRNIGRILIDGTSATVLLCDRQGKAIAPAMIYSDRCPLEVLEVIQQIVPNDSIACNASSSFAKLVTLIAQIDLARPSSDPASNLLYLLHQADWLGYCLHGKLGFSDYHNALKLGYDPQILDYPAWLKMWFRTSGHAPSLVLPQVCAPSHPVGIIQAAIAQKLALPLDCEIVAGTTDSNAAFIATIGTAAPGLGTAVTSLGSTMVLKVVSDRPINNANYGIYSHRWDYASNNSPQDCLWLVGGASNVGGAVLRQFFEQQQLLDLSAILNDRLNPYYPSPLDYYPLPQTGDRFPINDPALKPRLEPRPADPVEFLHGLLESMARIEAQGYDLLQNMGAAPVTQVYTAGGGAKNAVWTKIRDRHLPNLQSLSTDPLKTEAAYGSALLALGLPLGIISASSAAT